MSLSVISYGGGVQSTALLVLAAQGELDARVALFANVGDDSEHPATLRYVREVAMPYAAQHGLALHELHRRKRTGEIETLWGRMVKEGSKSLSIPFRFDNGAPSSRACTSDFKLRVIGKWLKAHGARKETPATVNIGISWDEIQRIGNTRVEPYERISYPLIDRRLTRTDCKAIITRAGLLVPPKSSCFFCPYHRPTMWQQMRRDEPDLFAQSVALERLLNDRRVTLGKDPVWLTRFAKPLDEAIPEDTQLDLFDVGSGPGETCDEGVCWV